MAEMFVPIKLTTVPGLICICKETVPLAPPDTPAMDHGTATAVPTALVATKVALALAPAHVKVTVAMPENEPVFVHGFPAME